MHATALFRFYVPCTPLGTIHWIQGNNKSVNVGDIIYIYESKPTAGIILKTEVIERDVTKYSIDDSQFWCIEPTLNPAGPWFTLKKINNIDGSVAKF